MSKKSKRKVSRGGRPSKPAPKPAATSQDRQPDQPQASGDSVSQSQRTTRQSGARFGMGSRRFTATPEFEPDYSYVKQDLKRIGVLAGSFLGIIVVLSFIIK